MNFVLVKSKKYNKGFATYVMKAVKYLYAVKANPQKIRAINQYLDANVKGKRKLNAFVILEQGFHNLECVDYGKTFDIHINPNAVVPNFNKTKIESLCKLINYGNSDLTPYPIFTEVFEYVKKNINALYNAYERGVALY